MILYGTMALLPNLLQDLMNYPVIYNRRSDGATRRRHHAGHARGGAGVHRIDVRAIMAAGFGLTAFALWQMTQLTMQMDANLFIISGFIQGVGIGFTFVPLSTATFATLAPVLRHPGTPARRSIACCATSAAVSASRSCRHS